MKKLLILTAVAMFAASTIGCNSCGRNSWCRGTTCNTCEAGPAMVGESYGAPGMMVTPGTDTIVTPTPN